MNFPHKNEQDVAALDRLLSTAYVEDDKPFLRTQRYSLSPDYEPSDVIAKQRVDVQSAQENQWWLNYWQKRDACT